MNYFAHALPFLDPPSAAAAPDDRQAEGPGRSAGAMGVSSGGAGRGKKRDRGPDRLRGWYFAAATGIPDWLTVVDRRVRLRGKHVEAFLADGRPEVAAIAGGILQHLRDDARFHGTRAFGELSLELTLLARDHLEADSGFRPTFLGHLLVEVLLDAALIADHPGRLEAYYAIFDKVDPAVIEAAVNEMAPRPTERLAWMIDRFRQTRILSDYAEDAKLFVRLNQVMRRAGLAELPDALRCILPEARRKVALRRAELLDGIPVGGSS
ncbi:MAG: hypothetical protein PHO07_03250 [Pirellulales bacterium]|jgi:hypothetical protein|nr:hypothetical protein [Thermoguttaceae bacterium]MDD4786164.1 hypothetical protein [Pirellulales bacterium]MDI9445344.1 hypothetical protein [Planctomycetota bacterium]